MLVNFYRLGVILLGLDFMGILVPVWDYSGSWDRYWDMAMEHLRKISCTAFLCFSQNGFGGLAPKHCQKNWVQIHGFDRVPMEIRLSATSARQRKVDQGSEMGQIGGSLGATKLV